MQKIEYDSYTRCKTHKTAYRRLARQINSMTDNSGLDDNYFEALEEAYGKGNDIKEFWKCEDGTFFRLTIEQIEDMFYVDCGFTV